MIKLIFCVIIGCFFSAIILTGVPYYYLLGMLGVGVIGALFIVNPLRFLWLLFLVRAAVDPLLVKIRFGFGGMDLGLGGAVSLLIIILTLVYFLTIGAQRSGMVNQPVVWVYLFFCMIGFFSFFLVPDKGETFKTLIRHFSVLSILVLTMLLVEQEKDGYQLIFAMILSPIFSVAVGLAQGNFIKEGTRFAGSLGHPNILAFYVLILLGCLFFGMDRWRHGISKLGKFRIAHFIFIFVVLVSTRTRSGWLAFAIMLFLYAASFNKKIFIPVILLLAGSTFLPMVQERILNTVEFTRDGVEVREESSLGWRMQKWEYLWNAGLKKPFAGHGLGASGTFGNDTLGAHNDYLRYFVETGFLGTFLYFFPYFYLFFDALKKRPFFEKGSLVKKLADFFIVFIPAFLIMSISENLASYVTVHWYLWCLVGIYLSLKMTDTRTEEVKLA